MSESDVCRRHILPYIDGPLTERVNITPITRPEGLKAETNLLLGVLTNTDRCDICIMGLL